MLETLIKPRKNKDMQRKIKVLMVCHGSKSLFWKNVGKARVVGV